ncbi:hypothetical protein [Actinomadura sp. HBU206391]|nr:hypothetical protein [Actinomadura sp. HBU206391]
MAIGAGALAVGLQRVWLQLTKAGRAAYLAHVAALQAIAGQ